MGGQGAARAVHGARARGGIRGPGALGRREALAQFGLVGVLAVGSLVVARRGAEAQAPAKIPRVGVVAPRTAAGGAPYLAALQQGLRDLGWVAGKTIATEVRWAEGRPDRVSGLVAELIRLEVDVIVAANTAIAVAAKQATTINLKTAKTLGLAIPPPLRARADRRIE